MEYCVPGDGFFSIADVHGVAKLLAMTGNAPSTSPAEPHSTFTLTCEINSSIAQLCFKDPSTNADKCWEAKSRACRDNIRLLLDRAATHVNPRIDPKRCSLHFSKDAAPSAASSECVVVAVCTVTSVPYPRHCFESKKPLLAENSSPDWDWKAAKKSYVEATNEKQKKKDASIIVSILYKETLQQVARQWSEGEGAGGTKGGEFKAGWLLLTKGVQFTASVVAVNDLYAFLAVAKGKGQQGEEQHFKILCKVPLPTIYGDEAAGKKKGKGSQNPPQDVSFVDREALLRITNDHNKNNGTGDVFGHGPVVYLRGKDRQLVEVVGSRVHMNSPTHWWIDDCHIVTCKGNHLECADELDTLVDVKTLAVLAANEQLEALKGVKREVVGYAHYFSNCSNVYFKKLKQQKKIDVPAITNGVVMGDESDQLEFKTKLQQVNGRAETTTELPNKKKKQEGNHDKVSSMSTERIRNVLASMMTTNGGVVMIGVNDKGMAVGHPRSENIAGTIRLTGYFPAVPKDTIVTRTLPAAANPKEGERGSDPKKLPPGWWKQAAASKTTGTVSQGKNEDKIVTALIIQPGSAPFYTSGKSQLPYIRTFASTIPMPMALMLQRIADCVPSFTAEGGDNTGGAEALDVGNGSSQKASGGQGGHKDEEGKRLVLEEALANAVRAATDGTVYDGE